MSDVEGVRGIVVGHGELAHGLVSAVRRIAGDAAEALEGVSNEGVGPEALRARIDELAGEGSAIVFVDISSGSCGMAALRCCRERSTRTLVSGVNLPMLLDFVFHRDLPIDELADRLVRNGRASIDRPGPYG